MKFTPLVTYMHCYTLLLIALAAFDKVPWHSTIYPYIALVSIRLLSMAFRWVEVKLNESIEKHK